MGEARDIAKEAWQLVANDFDLQKRAQFVLDYALALFANNQRAEAIDLVDEHVRGNRIVEPEYIIKEFSDAFGDLNDLG